MKSLLLRAGSAFALAAAAATTVFLLPGCSPGAASTHAAAGAEPQEIKWQALIPQDWDPTKRYRNISLEALRDNDPRAIQMLEEMREVWDNAPVNVALDGAAVKLPGFVVPLDNAPDGIREFLLVPYFGACIHTPPPPANQIVHVIAEDTVKGLRAMDTVWISGTLTAARFSSADMGVSGYEIKAAHVVKYTPPAS